MVNIHRHNALGGPAFYNSGHFGNARPPVGASCATDWHRRHAESMA